jgi:hypothetical protein
VAPRTVTRKMTLQLNICFPVAERTVQVPVHCGLCPHHLCSPLWRRGHSPSALEDFHSTSTRSSPGAKTKAGAGIVTLSLKGGQRSLFTPSSGEVSFDGREHKPELYHNKGRSRESKQECQWELSGIRPEQLDVNVLLSCPVAPPDSTDS